MKLRYLRRALGQIDEALRYVRLRSPQGAANVEARMMMTLVLLQSQPYIGTKTSVPGVRRVFLTPYPYIIDYYVGDDEIVVQRLRHTARRPVGS